MEFMRFYEIYLILKRQVFKSWNQTCQALAVDRPVDRTRSRSIGTVDRRARGRAHSQPLRPVDRAVDRLQVPHSRVGAVDRTVDRRLGIDRPRGRPTSSTVRNLTIGRSTGRSIGRAFQPFLAANGQNFYGAINTPLEVVFQQEFQELKFLSSLVFCTSFQKCF